MRATLYFPTEIDGVFVLNNGKTNWFSKKKKKSWENIEKKRKSLGHNTSLNINIPKVNSRRSCLVTALTFNNSIGR